MPNEFVTIAALYVYACMWCKTHEVFDVTNECAAFCSKNHQHLSSVFSLCSNSHLEVHVIFDFLQLGQMDPSKF